MAAFKYNRTITTTLKVVGIIDTDNGIITVEDEDKNLLNLIRDFNGAEVEIVVKVKSDEELEAPVEE